MKNIDYIKNIVDFESAEFIENPYPTYKYLRELNEPYWHESRSANMDISGMWMFSKYEDVTHILKESTSISKSLVKVRSAEKISPFDYTMLNQDPPNHTRLRNLVNKAFTPNQIKNLNPRIEAIVDRLITDMQSKVNPDFVTDFANLLPMIVIADFMGVPFSDQKLFFQWASDILCGYDVGAKNHDNFYAYRKSIQDMNDYFATLIDERRKNPNDSLISTLVEAHDKEDKLTSLELIGMFMLFIIAGHETTTNMISSGLNLLLKNPDQFDLLKMHPEYLELAIEEILRYEAPTQRGTFRITTQECEFGGKKFREGEQLVAMIGAANHDPSQFKNPEKLDITRNPNRHVSLGLGIHFCLGAFLARNEGIISLRRIIERIPNIQFAEEKPQWNNKSVFRGLKSMPVVL